MVKNLPVNVRDASSIPRLGIYPERGNGNPLQYSCLGNPMNRGAWQATGHGVTKSWIQLSDLTHTHINGVFYIYLSPCGEGWGLLSPLVYESTSLHTCSGQTRTEPFQDVYQVHSEIHLEYFYLCFLQMEAVLDYDYKFNKTSLFCLI